MASGEDALGSSLGRGIITGLAANLRGHVEYVLDEGTTVKVTFQRD